MTALIAAGRWVLERVDRVVCRISRRAHWGLGDGDE
jgi:hypothetical protein